MRGGEPLPLLGWFLLPLMCAACAAVAAVLHYGAAVRRGASDVPNLPMAMVGGAVAGFLSALLALVWQAMTAKPFQPYVVGIILAGLGGEYFGGRSDGVVPAMRAGTLAAVVLLPLGVGIMSVIR